MRTARSVSAGAARWTAATVLLLAVVAAVAAITLPSYGLTVDEGHTLGGGERTLAWYASGFTDRRAIDEGVFWLYGDFANVTAVVLHRALGTGPYETGHAVALVFGLAGAAISAWIARRLGGPRAGFLAALFLILTPVYYAHSIVNIKDVPFAALSIASFAAILYAWPALPRLERRHILVTGMAFGLTLAVRVVGAILALYAVLAALAFLWPLQLRSLRERRDELRRLATAALKISAVAFLSMLVWWPFAQVNPVINPARAFSRLTRFNNWLGFNLFNGHYVMSDQLPWTYVPVWFGIVLPEMYYVAAVLALAAFPIWRRRGAAVDRFRGTMIGLLAFTVAFPVATAMLRRPILYDGMRHLMFLVPPLAILAALGTSWFFDVVASRAARLVAAIAIAASAALTIADMVRLHPYQSVYFNRLTIGGLPGAEGRFETDYWGETFKEGTEWLLANVPGNPSRPLGVGICAGMPFMVSYHFAKAPEAASGFVLVDDLHKPHDILLSTTRFRCGERQGRVLHVISRFGVPLFYVKDLRVH